MKPKTKLEQNGFISQGIKELTSRFLFVVLVLFIYRIGVHIPVPGLDAQKLQQLFNNQSGNIINLFNIFSGGALFRFSVFALGIMPYISASIIAQILVAMIPSLEQLKKEGESGQRTINQYTRYGTAILAAVQAVVFARMLITHHVVIDPSFGFYTVSTITLVAGTIFLMWLGEQITERGLGNGISMIILFGIVARFPNTIATLFSQVHQGELETFTLLGLIFFTVVIILAIVFIESGQRKIIVHYAKQQHGRRLYMAQNSHLPLKINMAGVIPPIFAWSIILFPASLIQWLSSNSHFTWLSRVALLFESGQPLYLLTFIVVVMFFCFFYTALVFNPKDIAENLKKSGGVIPGIRPGEKTAQYIDRTMSRLTLFGGIYIVSISLLPQMVSSYLHITFMLAGTSLLITVVVIMDFITQVQSHLLSHQYGNLMKKTRWRGMSMLNNK